jgi:DNA anti-recombination protein RmuC
MRAVRPANLLIAIVAVLAIVFVIINWNMLGTPTAVSFGFAHVSVPAHRHHTAELRSQRELVENAEASRLTELRQYLQQELAALREQQRQSEQRLHDELVTTANSLSACVGEIDERLERHFPLPPGQQP